MDYFFEDLRHEKEGAGGSDAIYGTGRAPGRTRPAHMGSRYVPRSEGKKRIIVRRSVSSWRCYDFD